MPAQDYCWSTTPAWRLFFLLEALYYELPPSVDRTRLQKMLVNSLVRATRSTPSVKVSTVERFIRSQSLCWFSSHPRSTRLVATPVAPAATHVVWGKETRRGLALQVSLPLTPWDKQLVEQLALNYVEDSRLDEAGIALVLMSTATSETASTR